MRAALNKIRVMADKIGLVAHLQGWIPEDDLLLKNVVEIQPFKHHLVMFKIFFFSFLGDFGFVFGFIS